MAEQSHPPYVSGALTIPRQLERWLDINPQNGPLRRTETFFTLLSFSFTAPEYDFEFPYHGVIQNPSLIGAVFNYSSPNVFSFKGLVNDAVIGDLTYTLVVSSKNSDSTLTRYILWQGNPVIPLDIPQYSGQPINKTFRIEVWFLAGTIGPIAGVVRTIITSVLGNQDYRYGTDYALETLVSSLIDNSTPTDVFGVPALPATLPMTMPAYSYI